MTYFDARNTRKDNFAFDLDDKDVQGSVGGEFEVPPAGWYLASVDRVNASTTTAGESVVNIMYKIEAPEEYAGAAVWDMLVINSAKDFLNNRRVLILRALGHDTSKPIRLTQGSFLGRACCIKIKHETYEGKTRAKITPDGLAIASEFAELRQAAKSTKKGEARGTIPTTDDSSLPF